MRIDIPLILRVDIFFEALHTIDSDMSPFLDGDMSENKY